MDRSIQVQLGQDLVSFAENWQIASIRVDNPSGSWLHIENLNRYVPPYTLEYKADFRPATASITLRFTDSPTGTPSELIGEPITVQVFDTPQGNSQGYPSGAIQSGNPGQARIQVSAITVPVRESVSVQTEIILAGVPGSAIIPVRLYLSASTFLVGVGFTGKELRSIVTVDIVNGALSTLLPHLSISPEMPTASADFPIGTRVNEGDDIFAAGYTQIGSGEQLITVSIMYYRETVN